MSFPWTPSRRHCPPRFFLNPPRPKPLVLMLSLALGATGLFTGAPVTNAASPVSCPVWTGPLERLERARRPRLLSSAQVSGPLSWGLSPGVVLIDRASLRRPQTASAVMAHELAHLRRRDWLFLVLSRLAVALFWTVMSPATIG